MSPMSVRFVCLLAAVESISSRARETRQSAACAGMQLVGTKCRRGSGGQRTRAADVRLPRESSRPLLCYPDVVRRVLSAPSPSYPVDGACFLVKK